MNDEDISLYDAHGTAPAYLLTETGIAIKDSCNSGSLTQNSKQPVSFLELNIVPRW